jgi:hypothetical protein
VNAATGRVEAVTQSGVAGRKSQSRIHGRQGSAMRWSHRGPEVLGTRRWVNGSWGFCGVNQGLLWCGAQWMERLRGREKAVPGLAFLSPRRESHKVRMREKHTFLIGHSQMGRTPNKLENKIPYVFFILPSLVRAWIRTTERCGGDPDLRLVVPCARQRMRGSQDRPTLVPARQ